MRWAIFLPLFFVLLTAVPYGGAAESVSGQAISGEIAFTDPAHFDANLTLSVEYAAIDGRNMSARDIRNLSGTELEEAESELEGLGRELFNNTEAIFGAEGSASVSVDIGSSGPIRIDVLGNASMDEGIYDAALINLMADSGAVFHFNLSALNASSILIIPPPGFTANGEDSFLWDGSPAALDIAKSAEIGANRASALIDIYRIDTTGSDQEVHLRLSFSSAVHSIPYTADYGPVRIRTLTVPLINALIDRGMLDWSEVNQSLDSGVKSVENTLSGEFANTSFEKSSIRRGPEYIRISINGSASAPVSDVLQSSALLRRVLEERMSLKLYGIAGYDVNYTVLIPAGMILDSVEIEPSVPHHTIYSDGRYGFEAGIDDGLLHVAKVKIGIVVDMDPLIPLIVATALMIGFWAIFMRAVPGRRKRHGPR